MDSNPEVSGPAPQPIYEQATAPETVPPPSVAPESPDPKTEKHKRARKTLIVLISLLVVMALAGGAYGYWQSTKSNDSTTTATPTATPIGKVDTSDVQSDITAADTASTALDSSLTNVSNALSDQPGSLAE